MKFSKFDKIVTLVLLILLSVYGILTILDSSDMYYMNQRILNGGNLLGFIALIYIASFGTFLRNLWSLILFAILILVFAVSGLFKTLHWPYPDYLTTLSAIGILVVYGIHFYKKKQKLTLDLLKLLWVLLICLNSMLINVAITVFDPYLGHFVYFVFNVLFFVFAYHVLFKENPKRD